MNIDWEKIQYNLESDKYLTWMKWDNKNNKAEAFFMEPIDSREIIEWFKKQIEEQNNQK